MITTVSEILSRTVDYYESIASRADRIAIGKVLLQIQTPSPRVREIIARVRKEDGKRSADKRALPGVTLSIRGADTRAIPRGRPGARVHTGLVQIDIDRPDDITAAFLRLQDLPFIAAAFVSPSGTGVKAVAVVDCEGATSPDVHDAAFAAVAAACRRAGLEIDPAVKAWNHLMFVSHDPKLWVADGDITPLAVGTDNRLSEPISLQEFRSIRDESETFGPLPRESWDALGRLAVAAVPEEWETAGDHGTRDQWAAWAFAVRNVLLGRPAIGPGHPEYEERLQTAVELCEIADPPYPGEDYRRLFSQRNPMTRPALPLLESMSGSRLADYPGGEGPAAVGSGGIEWACDLMGDESLTAPEEIVEGLIHARGVTLINAGSKIGKTWLSLALAMTVAGGGTWLGRRCLPGKCLFLNFELWRETMRERLHKVSEALVATGALTKRQLREAQANLATMNLRGGADDYVSLLPRITKLLRSTGDAKWRLIVLDPLYRGLGESDENAAGDITRLYNALDRFVYAHDASLVITHHHPKGGGAQYANVFERGAGSGVHLRAPDTIANLAEIPDASEAAGVPVYRADWAQRSLAAPEPMALEWRYPLLVLAPEGSDIEALALDDARAPGAGGAAERRRRQEEERAHRTRAILEHVHGCEEPPTRREIIDWAIEEGMSESVAIRILRDLVRAKLLDPGAETPQAGWSARVTLAGLEAIEAGAESE